MAAYFFVSVDELCHDTKLPYKGSQTISQLAGHPQIPVVLSSAVQKLGNQACKQASLAFADTWNSCKSKALKSRGRFFHKAYRVGVSQYPYFTKALFTTPVNRTGTQLTTANII